MIHKLLMLGFFIELTGSYAKEFSFDSFFGYTWKW